MIQLYPNPIVGTATMSPRSDPEAAALLTSILLRVPDLWEELAEERGRR